MTSWRDLVRAPLRPWPAYHVPSYPDAVKLDANESPFALSPAASSSLAQALLDPALHRYPDAGARELRGILSHQLSVDGTELLFGNGSDELLALLCAAFGEPRPGQARAKLLFPSPGFVVFKTAAISHGLDVIEVPLGPRFLADEDALLAAVAREQPNLIFLATPNNPTGTVWPRSTVEKLIERHPGVITVVDEAYLAYHDAPTCSDLALAHPHCLCLGTLSKIGLAGLRVGYLIGRREVVAEVEKVRPPYNLSTLAQRAATVLLREHRAELEAHFREVKEQRAALAGALSSLPGFEVFPSGANFLLVRVADARGLFQGLAERGVVVRCFDQGALKGCLRITIGTPVENASLLDALRSFLGSALIASLLGACVEVAPASQSGDLSMPRVESSDGGDGGGVADLTTVVSCTSTCFNEGASQCDANGHLQTCTKVGACLQWSVPADCPTNQICCDTACVAADEQNCWACGTVCGGPTPFCSPTLQRCVCTPQSCAPTQHDCDPTFGICVACVAPPVPESRSDFYVDANAAATPTGSLGCPYQLISDALAPAGASSAAQKTVHVAAGTYSSEIFPIVLRGGISLAGAGAGQTIIQGDGTLDHTAAGGALNTAGLFATILTGDAATPSEIKNLTVSATSATPTSKHYGIFCDQGNAPATITNPPSPSPFPSPTTTLTSVTLGPGYDYGLIATNTTAPAASACNVKMVSSTLQGNSSGAWVVGCGTGGPGGIVAAQLGDSAAATGNHFINNTAGYGLVVWDCSSPVLISNNIFDGNAFGMALAQHPRLDSTIPVPGYITVDNNTFQNMTGFGIDMGAAVIIEHMLGNLFTNISSSSAAAAALVLENSSGGASNYRPQIKRARNNQFIGNDIGVLFRGSVPIAPDPNGFDTDFGTPGDPGNNVFVCNSGLTTSLVVGYDVEVVSASTGGGSLRFSGNQWDHAPPNVVTATSGANGTDVLRGAASAQPAVAVDNATVSTAMCPANRSP